MILNQHHAGCLFVDRRSKRTSLAKLSYSIQIGPMNRCVSVFLTGIRLAIMLVGMVQLAAVPAALPADLTRTTLHSVSQSQTTLLSGNRSLQFANLSAPSTASNAIPKLYGPQPDLGLPGSETRSAPPSAVPRVLAWRRPEPLQLSRFFRVPQARAPPTISLT